MNAFYQKKDFFLLLFLLVLGLQGPLVGQAAIPFTDIKKDHWAYSSIEWSVKNKIIAGYSDQTFRAQRTLTEAEFVVMLTRYNCSTDSVLDKNKNDRHWASDAYANAKNKNLPLKGYDHEKFRDQPISRGQIARIVTAFNGVDLSEIHAVQYMYVHQLSSGLTGKRTYDDYGADRFLNRGEAAVFLHRLSQLGQCQMKGLAQSPSGKQDSQYPLPAYFHPEKTAGFPLPGKNDQQADPIETIDARLMAADIEKKTLTANGSDSTFITLTLKDCYGNPISYDESLSFQATSKAGAVINHEEQTRPVSPQTGDYTSSAYSQLSQTDGPDITLKVTAPLSAVTQNDAILFQINETDSKMACYRTPVSVKLTYKPKAELQVKTTVPVLSANGKATTQVTASIVSPGGQILSDFRGRVHFRSAMGAVFSNQEAVFVNGTATATLSALSSSFPLTDEIFANLIEMDPRYSQLAASLKSEISSTEVVYDPGLSAPACPRENVEAAFIIDSSGSMKRSDPERLRVLKSQELLRSLNTPSSASHFNHTGMLLSGLNDPLIVSSRLNGVFQTGGTNIGAGMQTAFSQFSESTSGKKVAILITDGKSNKQKVLDMITEAKRKNITVFTVGLGSKKQLNETLLHTIAHETGGHYFHAEKSSDIGKAYQSILNQITCGELYAGCTQSDFLFSSPSIIMNNAAFSMNTFVSSACSADVDRVALQFQSASGTLEYELIPRGQHYFALEKDVAELSRFVLINEGTFFAYNQKGDIIGHQRVPIYKK